MTGISPVTGSLSNGKAGKDYGEGYDCLHQALVVEGLNLTKAEYMCLCFSQCTEEDIKDLERDIVNLAVDQRQHHNRVSINFRTTFLVLILLSGIFGKLTHIF